MLSELYMELSQEASLPAGNVQSNLPTAKTSAQTRAGGREALLPPLQLLNSAAHPTFLRYAKACKTEALHTFPVSPEPRTGHSSLNVASPGQSRGRGRDLPRPAGHALLNAPQDTGGLLGHKDTLLAHGQHVVLQNTQSSSPVGHPLTCTDACNYSSPGTRLYTCSC